MALIFSAAVLVCVAALTWRLLGRRINLRAARNQPGRSPERALPVTRFDQIDAALVEARCPCGGRLSRISEGSRSLGSRALRVVHTECALCEEEHDLFFDLSELVH